jgi:hypothetical protein
MFKLTMVTSYGEDGGAGEGKDERPHIFHPANLSECPANQARELLDTFDLTGWMFRPIRIAKIDSISDVRS